LRWSGFAGTLLEALFVVLCFNHEVETAFFKDRNDFFMYGEVDRIKECLAEKWC